jgi:hypothetical protein
MARNLAGNARTIPEEDTMNRTDTDAFGIPSLASIREGAHSRTLVAPPPFPGLGQRGVSSRLHRRLARLVSAQLPA